MVAECRWMVSKSTYYNHFAIHLVLKFASTLHTDGHEGGVWNFCGKKVMIFQKWPKWCFWWLITLFLSVFKNTKQNNNCIFIVFKAESEPKHEDKFFLAVFLQKPKTCFFGGKHKIVLKLKFQICISVFVLYCERKLRTNFHTKNINI